MNRITRWSVAGVAAIVLASSGAAAQAPPPSGSADQAHMLVELMKAQGIQAIAAKDPAAPNRYVAALYVPGAELLVVSATYPVPSALDARLEKREYREAYVDLQSTTSATDRLFVEDMQANGLLPECGEQEPFDIVSQNGAETRFNGNWAGQKLTESAYKARYEAMNARYAKMLSVLIARLRPTT